MKFILYIFSFIKSEYNYHQCPTLDSNTNNLHTRSYFVQAELLRDQITPLARSRSNLFCTNMFYLHIFYLFTRDQQKYN